MEELNKDSISKNENDTILSWIKYLETIRGYGEHTLDAYKRDVSEFSNFCIDKNYDCLLYTSPSPRDRIASRMPSSA